MTTSRTTIYTLKRRVETVMAFTKCHVQCTLQFDLLLLLSQVLNFSLHTDCRLGHIIRGHFGSLFMLWCYELFMSLWQPMLFRWMAFEHSAIQRNGKKQENGKPENRTTPGDVFVDTSLLYLTYFTPSIFDTLYSVRICVKAVSRMIYCNDQK